MFIELTSKEIFHFIGVTLTPFSHLFQLFNFAVLEVIAIETDIKIMKMLHCGVTNSFANGRSASGLQFDLETSVCSQHVFFLDEAKVIVKHY